jgi:hypothetical protein
MNMKAMWKIVLMLTAVASVGLMGAAPAQASAYSCTNVLLFTYQCIDANGSGLHVDSVYGDYKVRQESSTQGKFEQRARVTKPNGKVIRYTSPSQQINCSAGSIAPQLCWRYKFTKLSNTDWPNQTEICTATFRIYSDGSKQMDAGWACATVHD